MYEQILLSFHTLMVSLIGEKVRKEKNITYEIFFFCLIKKKEENKKIG